MSIIKRVFYCLFFTIILLLLSYFRGFSSEIPLNNGNICMFMENHFTRIDNMEDKVNLSLNLIKIIHPNWRESYEFGVFDCSEMSAYVKYFFGICGIKSNYCQSNMLWHCWVEVPIENEDKILIECTGLRIVPKEDWNIYYKHKDVRYNCKMRTNEVDWYNSPSFN